MLMLSIFVLSSCAPRRGVEVERDAHAVTIGDVVVNHKAVVADLKIGEKRVSRSERWTLGRNKPEAIELRKQVLMTQLLDQSGADVLVGTKVDVRRKWTGATKLTLTGFPANYDGVRTATDADLADLKTRKSVEEQQIMVMVDSISPGVSFLGVSHSLPLHTWRVLVGGHIANYSGTSNVRGAGSVAADYRLRLFGRWYYGAMLGLEFGALHVGDEMPFYAGVNLVPVRLGRDFYVNNQHSFYLHAGAALKWIPFVKPNGCCAQSGSSYLPDSKGFGAGLELAAGWQWNRFSFQFAPNLYFRPYSDGPSLITDFTISLGVRF